MNAISRIETDEEYAARIDALNAAEEAAWEAERASRPAEDDHEHWFFEYQDNVIDALIAEANWHIDRAKERGVQQGHAAGPNPYSKDPALCFDTTRGAIDAVVDAACDLGCKCQDGEDDAAIDAASDALHAAISHAKGIAERQCWASQAADDQCHDVDESRMRGWARMFDSIEHCRRMARDYPEDATRWQLAAAHDLLFNAPARIEL